MATRTLVFVALASLVVLTASMLQNAYQPTPQGSSTEVVADSSTQEEKSSPSNSTPDDENQAKSISETSDSDSKSTVSDSEVPSVTKDMEKPGEDATESAAELYTLGSVAADSKFRFLVTFSSEGATVSRVELNFRDLKGHYRYRDVEYWGGYLGELDCVTSPLGCKVRVVGNGTPAALAGLKPGDIIRSLDSEPVTTAEDFADMMSKTEPGKTIRLGYSRNNSDQQVEIELTDKPIELIRPEPDLIVEGQFGDPSFRTTLMATTPNEEVWPLLDENMMDGTWKLENHTDNEISFSYEISRQAVGSNQSSGSTERKFSGPYKITKTYRLPEVDDIQTHQEGVRDFHFELSFAIENLSDQSAAITYEMDGPLGTPTETWWYQNKIHGRNTAVGYVAGARDLISSTGQNEFKFFGGPELVKNYEQTAPEYFWLLQPPAADGGLSQTVNYLSVDTQYFNVALLPISTDQPFDAYSVLAEVVNVEIPKNARKKKLVDCTFKMFKNLQIEPGETYRQDFQIFAGPKEHEILAAYGLQDARSFGWFAIFSKPLCWLLKIFYYITGQIGYGIPIILLTVLVRSLMIPISRRAAINAQMMQYLQPQMKEIADKYKDDMEKRSVAQQNLFRKYNYNPFGGCFLMFLQIPIFIGLYRGLSVDIALRDQPLLPGLSWCSDLSAPDQFWYWKEWLPTWLGSETGWLGPYFNLLPIITCVLFIIQQKLFTPPPTDEQQELMQKMMKYMMIAMGFMFFKVPAGLCLYFITSSLWGIIERKMLPKPELDKSKLDDLLDSDSQPDRATIRKVEKERLKREKAEEERQADLDEKKRRDKDRKKRLKRRDAN